ASSRARGGGRVVPVARPRGVRVAARGAPRRRAATVAPLQAPQVDQEELVEEGAMLLFLRADRAQALRQDLDEGRDALDQLATADATLRLVVQAPEQVVDDLQRHAELAAVLAVAQHGGAQVPQPDLAQELLHGFRHGVPRQAFVEQALDPLGDLALLLTARPPGVVTTIAPARRRFERGALAHDALDELADMAGRPRVLALALLRHHRGAGLQGAGHDLD